LVQDKEITFLIVNPSLFSVTAVAAQGTAIALKAAAIAAGIRLSSGPGNFV